MADKRVLAGSPEDFRWQPGMVSGMAVPEPEEEPAIEPEMATEDLAAIAVSPKDLPDEVVEVPEVVEAPSIEPPKEGIDQEHSSVELPSEI